MFIHLPSTILKTEPSGDKLQLMGCYHSVNVDEVDNECTCENTLRRGIHATPNCIETPSSRKSYTRSHKFPFAPVVKSSVSTNMEKESSHLGSGLSDLLTTRVFKNWCRQDTFT